MKNKKTKFIKLLSIGGAFMAIGAVPIAMTACAKKSASQTVTKVTPKIKSDITLVGKFSDLVSVDADMSTDQLISKDLQEDLSKVVDNSEQLNGAKVTFNSNLSEEDKKFNDGTKDYSEWKVSASSNVVYYSSTSPQLNVKSTKDLNTQITTNLDEIIKKTGFTDASTKDFKLNGSNKIGIDNDKLHVSVTATDKGAGKAEPTEIDLVIPTSDINFTPEKSTVEISGTNVDTKKQQVTFKYDVGIDSTVNYTKTTIDLEAGKDITNGTDVLEALGWNKAASVQSKQLSRNALMSTFAGGQKAGTDDIDSQKMGNDIGVFNSKFTNFQVIETEKGSGLYNLTVSATPNEGYLWDDGTNTTKNLTIASNVDINVKDAEVTSAVTNNVESSPWGLNMYNKGPSGNEIETIKTFFKTQNNINDLLNYVNNDSTNGIINTTYGKQNLINVEFTSIKADNIKLIDKKAKTKAGEKEILIPLVLSPKNSHTWKDSSASNIWTKDSTYFYVTIPTKVAA
ncbi:P35 family lipoprotein [Malacoplasma iowae]|uniref:P35 family lipoprotein n=1 Tax=Malacoplasma iowae 695 TaxID=1048830 RepID=A0A6P1LF50_MALIO|nr:P35 family lipoprotein [Malacoplasma iowae]VEU61889.1 Lipoprotein p35 precursor [Mycoplasmopsis fermentans]EGZ31070.1 P35 lipoprotein [Malacoplasma iowae 695]QHG90078.1 P35 family lipoprotein [Malacoplasma iowae 695]WPL36188.1 P35 family lipoprotein [Malacoplasma iowae]VEU70874.1 Lipoprotein p35 precursor [Malacoplasma iowae]